MKCKNCGAQLIYTNDGYLCENCGTKFQVSDFYENIDVFIAYIENDISGRRTKDSIIAQDIYQKLEGKKIRTFFNRISIAELYGDELEQACNAAVVSSKVVIVLGTSKENFDSLTNRYFKYWNGKIIIPVFCDMDISGVPKSLSKIQALNYNKVGADVDLINAVLSALGQKVEISYTDLSKKASIQRIKIFLTIIIAIILVAVLAFVIWKMHFVPNNRTEKVSQLTEQEIYDNAQTLLNNGKNLEAASEFQSIVEFKNSKDILKSIYDRYDGYYQSSDSNTFFYINIQDGKTAELILERIEKQSAKVRVKESAELVDNTIKLSFTDSQSNTGNMTVILNDDNIIVKTVTESANNSVSIGDLDLIFLVKDKGDRPIESEVNADTIFTWLSKRTYLNDLKQSGYDLNFVKIMTAGGGTFNHAKVYKIANTDIQVMVMDFDLSTTQSFNEIEVKKINDYAIVGVAAPANLVCPQKIGENSQLYVENDILYVPNMEYWQLSNCLSDYTLEYCVAFETNQGAEIIDKSSIVGMTSKCLIGEYNFGWLVEQQKDPIW